MKEYVTANNKTLEFDNISTGTDTITMTVENGNADALEEHFRAVTEMTVSDSALGEPYGTYTDLAFKEITTHEDGSVSITMRIKSDIEKRLDALEDWRSQVDTEYAAARLSR